MHKYRAWDTDKQVMMYDGIIFDMSNLNVYAPKDKGVTPNIILLQFTGLLDMNDKEIFHGDIVKIKFDVTQQREIFLRVEWADGMMEGLSFLGWWFMEMGANSNHMQSAPASNDYKEGVEVVGNIFENHEFIPCEHGIMMRDQCLKCGRAKEGSMRQ